MLKFNMMKQDKTVDGGAGEASQTPPPAATPESKTPATPEATGDSLDQFGYEKVPSEAAPAEVKKTESADSKAETKIAGDGDIADPASGYGKDPVKIDPLPEKVIPEPEVKLEYEVDVKDMDVKEANKLKDFAKNNKLPKEAAQALIDLRKTEIKAQQDADAQFIAEQKQKIQQTRATWDNELPTDPVFGGDKFAHNVMRAEKVLAEFMPDTKKALTEAKSMLPPYVMRDLAKLADHLYQSQKLVQGDSPVGSGEDEAKKGNDPLDFYT